MTRPSIYDFAGGEPAFQALAAAHHARCLADPVLAHPFEHPGHPEHVTRLGWYWAEVFGGPPKFTEAAGGHTAVLRLHSGTGADEDLGERFLAAFLGAIDDAGLPEDPRLRAALAGYMRWAVDEVMAYSPMDPPPVPADLPVPRWSWDGRQS